MNQTPPDRRADFPLLWHQSLSYLDNAATTHKPQSVIDAISDCYRRGYAPIHRGIYPLAESASAAYETARKKVAAFINAAAPERVVFTRSATEAINMVAQGWARQRLRPGERVWVTRMEHHSNFLPWQRVCAERGAELRVIELDEDGSLEIDKAAGLFNKRTRLIALCHVSNALGRVNPVNEICDLAAARNIPVLVDAAQSAAAMPLDVQKMNCDFLAFSAHKIYGPTGIGVLYAKRERLEQTQPLLLGGGMVDEVHDDDYTASSIPARFEAGSPNLAAAVGLAAAVDYLSAVGMRRVQAHLGDLAAAAVAALSRLSFVKILPAVDIPRSSIVSFTMPGVHPHDIAQIAADHAVALRAGHHCCRPLMRCLGIDATARASFAWYNDADDIDALAAALERAWAVLGP